MKIKNVLKAYFNVYQFYILIGILIVGSYFFFGKTNVEKGYDKGVSSGEVKGYYYGYSQGAKNMSLKYIDYISPEQQTVIREDTEFRNDAKSIAKVLYGFSGYNLSDNAKAAIIEVILSRVACTYGEFGNTISEVCEKENQWQGYTGDYLEEDYKLALDILSNNDRGRVTPVGCLFLTCDYGKVTVRSEWNSKSSWEIT